MNQFDRSPSERAATAYIIPVPVYRGGSRGKGGGGCSLREHFSIHISVVIAVCPCRGRRIARSEGSSPLREGNASFIKGLLRGVGKLKGVISSQTFRFEHNPRRVIGAEDLLLGSSRHTFQVDDHDCSKITASAQGDQSWLFLFCFFFFYLQPILCVHEKRTIL